MMSPSGARFTVGIQGTHCHKSTKRHHQVKSTGKQGTPVDIVVVAALVRNLQPRAAKIFDNRPQYHIAKLLRK